MSLTPNLPKQFILARESDPLTLLPERPPGTYLGARVYAALRTKGPDPKKDYYVGFSGGPVLAPQGFYPLEAPMGASTKKGGSRFWSEDKDGSIFSSSAGDRLVFKPGQVELGIKLGGLGTKKLEEGLEGLKSSASGAYVPGEVYARIESLVGAAQQHISKLASMLPTEKSEQIGPAAKREFELAARNRAQAAEWLEFAKLRSSELLYRDLKCGDGSKIDFMSGECMSAPAEGSPSPPRQPRPPGASKPASGASATTPSSSSRSRRASHWSGGAIAGVVVGTLALLGVAGAVVIRRANRRAGSL